MVNEQFDATLESYRPTSQKKVYPVSKTLVEHFEDWVRNYGNMDCERDVDYNSTLNR